MKYQAQRNRQTNPPATGIWLLNLLLRFVFLGFEQLHSEAFSLKRKEKKGFFRLRQIHI